MKTKSILLLVLFSIILSFAACKDPRDDHDHQWGNWEVTKPATCSAEGEETRTCEIDGTKDTRKIPIDPEAHDYQWETTTPATCTTVGEETGTCKHNPQHTITRELPIDPDAHVWNDGVVTLEPTCTETGTSTRVCTLCEKEDFIIPALGHDYRWLSTATETEDGTELLTCTHDNSHTSGSSRITYATGTAGLNFTLITSGTNAGTYRVSKGAFNGAAVHIPAWHRPDVESPYAAVTEISSGVDSSGDNAFGGASTSPNNTLTAVTFAANSQLNTIGAYAFYYCAGINGVDIPQGVRSVGVYAFAGCRGITDFTIPNSVTSIGIFAFSGCTGIAEMTIPSSVTSIGFNAFQNWAPAQTINAKHHTNQAAADAVWGGGAVNWRTNCYAVIVYGTAPVPFNVTNLSDWNAAVSAIVNGGGNTRNTININGSISVNGTTDNTFGTRTGIEVTLSGSGTLTLSSNGSLIRIGAQQALIIDGVTLTGRENNNQPLVHVEGAGTTLELKNGNITGNKLNEINVYGGGVFVQNGSFTMSGGSISNNMCRGANQVQGNQVYGVTGSGGGVCVIGGSFTMSGGSISGNSANAVVTGHSTARGGGVCVIDGTFTMSGGDISGNSVLATSSSVSNTSINNAFGGGVYVNRAFTMLGGTVSGNSALAHSGNNNIAQGGGVYVAEGSTFFRMVNGTVYGSNANTQSNTVSLDNMNGTASAAALYIGIYVTAQRGIFNGSTWVSKENLSSGENTVSVTNGELHP